MALHPSPTVLIVDDELFFRTLLRDILENEGLTVVAEAVNGDEALEKFRQFRPDITFMDIFMPEKNGIEATREIMAIDRSANILVCSAAGFDEELQAAHAAGARQAILKPFMLEEIREALRDILAA